MNLYDTLKDKVQLAARALALGKASPLSRRTPRTFGRR